MDVEREIKRLNAKQVNLELRIHSTNERIDKQRDNVELELYSLRGRLRRCVVLEEDDLCWGDLIFVPVVIGCLSTAGALVIGFLGYLWGYFIG